jgi:hypothetical protein
MSQEHDAGAPMFQGRGKRHSLRQKRCQSLHTICRKFQEFYLRQKTFTSGNRHPTRAP